MGRDRDDRWVAPTCGLSVARQNGKNGAIEMRELFGMVALGEKFLHTAHEVKTARKAFLRLKHFFGEKAGDPGASFPELNALVADVRSTNGQEAIILRNGGSVEFVARSKGSGRGFTVDTVVFDEAQFLTDEELEALGPTKSASPLGNPQTILTGTPPNPEKNQTAEVFMRVRTNALEGSPRVAWTDFGVPDGPMPDVTDRDLWFETNPALGIRLNVDDVADELTMYSPEGFARERLGWWGDPDGLGGWIIPRSVWVAQCNPKSKIRSRPVFAIEVARDRSVAYIAAAGAAKTGEHFELIRYRLPIAELVPQCVRLMRKHEANLFIIDAAAEAAGFKTELVEAGVRVHTTDARQMVAACGYWFDSVTGGKAFHIGQDEVDAALAGAVWRELEASRALGRRKSAVDIAPLVACVLALWGHHEFGDYDLEKSFW